MSRNPRTKRKVQKPRAYSVGEIIKGCVVSSCADGTLTLKPVYRKGAGGVLSRLALAARVQNLIRSEID